MCGEWCKSRLLEWRSIELSGRRLEQRHVLQYLTATLVGNSVFVIGQFLRERDAAANPTACVVQWLDCTTYRWSTKDLVGPNVYGHCTALTRDRLVILGGLLQDTTINNTIWSFDLNLLEFTAVRASGHRPRSRVYHSGEFLERADRVVIFGGYNVLSDSCLNDLLLFDLASHTWLVPKVKGAKPSLRARQASCMVGNIMYIYGGQPAIQEPAPSLGDMHILQCGKTHFTWSSPQLQGPPLFGASLSNVGDYLVVYGSMPRVLIYDLKSQAWQSCGWTGEDKFRMQGLVRPARNEGNAAVVVNNAVLVLGGRLPLGSCRLLLEVPEPSG